jgi:hypothetical protein
MPELSMTGGAPRPVPARESERREALFAERLRRRAEEYFPESGGTTPEVSLRWRRVRSYSALYGFEVTIGGRRHEILVKVLSSRPDPQPRTGDPTKDRPRLMRGFDPELRCRMEYDLLATLYGHIRGLEDPRFDAVRVYDAFPAERALVMKLVPDASLRDLVARPWRRSVPGRRPDPERLFRNAGAWLNMYHGLSRPTPFGSRHARREDFLGFNLQVTEYLARTVGRASFFRNLASRLDRAGRAVLPETLPLGLGHCDYAMRNVLVGQTGAVSVIDANGRWYTPIYEDIGYLLIDLECNEIQVLSRGRALKGRIRIYEQAFLEGYFGRGLAGELELVRLYQIQACLDKWASRVADLKRARGLAPRMLRAARVGFTTRYFRKVIEGCLRDLPE